MFFSSSSSESEGVYNSSFASSSSSGSTNSEPYFVSSSNSYSSNCFSTSGILEQLKISKKAILSSPPAIGVLADDGIVLVAFIPKPKNHLQVHLKQRMFQANAKIAMTYAGLQTDSHLLASRIQKAALAHEIKLMMPPTTYALANDLAQYMHIFATDSAFRPLGVEVILAGYDRDEEFSLIHVENGGGRHECCYIAIGRQQTVLENYLREKTSEDMLLADATIVALSALRDAFPRKVSLQTIQIAHITDKGYKELKDTEILAFLRNSRR